MTSWTQRIPADNTSSVTAWQASRKWKPVSKKKCSTDCASVNVPCSRRNCSEHCAAQAAGFTFHWSLSGFVLERTQKKWFSRCPDTSRSVLLIVAWFCALWPSVSSFVCSSCDILFKCCKKILFSIFRMTLPLYWLSKIGSILLSDLTRMNFHRSSAKPLLHNEEMLHTVFHQTIAQTTLYWFPTMFPADCLWRPLQFHSKPASQWSWSQRFVSCPSFASLSV